MANSGVQFEDNCACGSERDFRLIKPSRKQMTFAEPLHSSFLPMIIKTANIEQSLHKVWTNESKVCVKLEKEGCLMNPSFVPIGRPTDFV